MNRSHSSAPDHEQRVQMVKAPRRFLSDHALPWLASNLLIFYNIWLSLHDFVPRKRTLEWVAPPVTWVWCERR